MREWVGLLTAMAMAMEDSVTVSMGDEMRGVFSVILRVSAEVRSWGIPVGFAKEETSASLGPTSTERQLAALSNESAERDHLRSSVSFLFYLYSVSEHLN